ncbi:hypothetical protein LSAT2_005804 [Lamellibrachia satsuma]|nr:hypothetical protein LSAT2_005804 [Lamellibrachia satsuma]
MIVILIIMITNKIVGACTQLDTSNCKHASSSARSQMPFFIRDRRQSIPPERPLPQQRTCECLQPRVTTTPLSACLCLVANAMNHPGFGRGSHARVFVYS